MNFCSTWNCIRCFEIWAGAQLEPVFGGSATRFKFFKSASILKTDLNNLKDGDDQLMLEI